MVDNERPSSWSVGGGSGGGGVGDRTGAGECTLEPAWDCAATGVVDGSSWARRVFAEEMVSRRWIRFEKKPERRLLKRGGYIKV